jgi:hypothetical protein
MMPYAPSSWETSLKPNDALGPVWHSEQDIWSLFGSHTYRILISAMRHAMHHALSPKSRSLDRGVRQGRPHLVGSPVRGLAGLGRAAAAPAAAPRTDPAGQAATRLRPAGWRRRAAAPGALPPARPRGSQARRRAAPQRRPADPRRRQAAAPQRLPQEAAPRRPGREPRRRPKTAQAQRRSARLLPEPARRPAEPQAEAAARKAPRLKLLHWPPAAPAGRSSHWHRRSCWAAPPFPTAEAGREVRCCTHKITVSPCSGHLDR